MFGTLVAEKGQNWKALRDPIKENRSANNKTPQKKKQTKKKTPDSPH